MSRRINDDLIIQEAKKYKHKKDFVANDRRMYMLSISRGKEFHKKCTEHMIPLENFHNSDIGVIYGYFFEDNNVYIGSTIQPIQRKNEHHRRGKISKKIKTGLKYEYQELEKFVNHKNILDREQFFIDHFTNLGFNIMNSTGAHSRGGISQVSNKIIIEEALKYTSVKEWREKSGSTYSAAKNRGLYAQLSKNMLCDHKVRTNEEILEDAKKYSTKSEWSSSSPNIYRVALNRGIIKECSEHMKILLYEWTDEEILTEARKYKNTKEWVTNSRSTYNQARSSGILKQCSAHFTPLCRQWTNEELLQESLKYNNFTEWRKHDNRSYALAYRRKLITVRKNNSDK